MSVLSLASATWQFRDASQRSRWLPAIVPGCVHTDLLRNKEIPDPFWGTNELDLQWIEERAWEYRATFKVPADLLHEDVVELVADGLDTVATVFLNGEKIAATDNMFIGHRWDIKPLLRAGKNELLIHFASALDYIRAQRLEHQPREFNDPVGRCSVIRKEQCQFGWDWGPRFVTAGIWRDLRIEAASTPRLETVLLTQTHAANGAVSLALAPEVAGPNPAGVTYYVTISLGDAVVVQGDALTFAIPEPQLWWPNGHGAQPLYTVRVELHASAQAKGRATSSKTAPLDVWERRIGLRTIVLDRHKDQWGESFQFVVNGRAIFAKGANWIPAHSFVAGLTREDYARDLRSAAQAHMNMVRVWGGGIYESEHFYDVCDELGLLVWQDFMFACTLYPGDAAFFESVRTEATQQLRRIRHRASLALWCGNNEIEGLNLDLLKDDATLRKNYDALFHDLLDKVAREHDPVTPYWPSSPYRPDRDHAHAKGAHEGDTHFWDVWHSRKPVKDYEIHAFRFCSEFGMQSYSSPQTQATFCPPQDGNVFGAVMENHQKNRGGNQVILDYVSRRYRLPKNQEALIYLSQLNQAYCMQTGVEHWRRNMPRSMGALYWQINDCWPVASWSSIEFTGRWKALHHLARRFFAPALVTAHVPGDETPIIGNYRRSTVREVHLYTAYDAPEAARGTLRWDLFNLGGQIVQRGKKAVALRYGESTLQQTLDLARPLERYGRDSLYLRIALDIDGATVSEDTVFLTPPRFLSLPRGRVAVKVRARSSKELEVTFTSKVFQHRFAFDAGAALASSSDNYFELYPNEPKTVVLTFARPVTAAALGKALTFHSLADTY